VDPVPDPLLLRKSGSAGNRTGPVDLQSETRGLQRVYLREPGKGTVK
jgi:hypothetical protein